MLDSRGLRRVTECAGTHCWDTLRGPVCGGYLAAPGSAILRWYGTVSGIHLRPPREGSTPLNLESRNLVAAASKGDVEAFAKLVRDHSSLVYRVALRMLGQDDAQDASQEVWMRVWRNIRNFRGESAFSTWIYRITVNTCLSIRQKEARREERELGEETPYLSEPQGGDADPEAAALNAERREEIQVALQHVRAEHRAALVLRHMEGLSYAEIAEVLEVPDGTAKGWVSRGRAAMLVALAELDGLHRKTEAGG
jgi:RNA polymerase sigma-70 factor, ECF subfamily